MENVTNTVRGLVSDPLSAWPVMQEKTRHVLALVKAHPWISVGVAAGTALVWSYVRTPGNLPPGPWGYPIIGATVGFSPDLPKKMFDWRAKYGEVVSYYMFGELNVVLNSERTIKDGFVKQSEDFSHRTDLFEGLGVEDEIFCAPFNEIWKKNKKFATSTLKNYGFGTAKSEGKIHEQLQYLEEFILKASASPIDVFPQFKLLSAGTIGKIFLGSSGNWDDPDTKEIQRLMEDWYGGVNKAVMKSMMYQMVIPKTLAEKLAWREFAAAKVITMQIVDLLRKKINVAASDIAGRAAESVVDAYVKERGTDPEVIMIMAKTIMAFLPDAIDTTPILMYWSLLYVTLHEDVQERLYKEVDRVVGASRPPTLTDRAEMPYIQAFMAEVFRFVLPTPMSLRRILPRDVKIGGYTLPKGTLVAGNFYAVHFDPEAFKDPLDFKPSRFIDLDGKFNTALAGKIMSFGTGTRKCLGEPYVKLYMFFFLARVMQRFKMTFDPSEPTPSTAEDSKYFFAKPESFKVCFTAR